MIYWKIVFRAAHAKRRYVFVQKTALQMIGMTLQMIGMTLQEISTILEFQEIRISSLIEAVFQKYSQEKVC